MISVVPEEEEEDINMESYGEDGYEHGYEWEYKGTEGEEAPPPEYTKADEGYQSGEGDNNGLSRASMAPLNIPIFLVWGFHWSGLSISDNSSTEKICPCSWSSPGR